MMVPCASDEGGKPERVRLSRLRKRNPIRIKSLRRRHSMRHNRTLFRVALTACLTMLVGTATAQDPPTSFVSKLGFDIDVRSGGRILADDILSSNVILPELGTPV